MLLIFLIFRGCISPDGQFIASGSAAQTIQIVAAGYILFNLSIQFKIKLDSVFALA